MNPGGRFLSHLLFCFWLVLSAVPARAATWYVWTNSPANGPGTAWSNAFHDIQSAVDAAQSNDTVLVTNGVYASGGGVAPGRTLWNRVVVTIAITVESVNGCGVTTVDGGYPMQTNRCFYLGDPDAVVDGFTITNGYVPGAPSSQESRGGGVYAVGGALVRNCTIMGNRAVEAGGMCGGIVSNSVIAGNAAVGGGWSGPYGGWGTIGHAGGVEDSHVYGCILAHNSAPGAGGGAEGGTLENCLVISNTATWGGGGAQQPTWINCLLTGNWAGSSGGGGNGRFYSCTIVGNAAGSGRGGVDGWEGEAYAYNCIIYSNTAPDGANYKGGTYEYCCTLPGPAGVGNITNDPGFVNLAGGDLRLRPDSPCINTGTNQVWMVGAKDLDGNDRVGNGRVDMGAYESAYWGTQSDVDGDGMIDADEIVAGTDPTNAGSVLGVGVWELGPGAGHVITWPSVSNRWYAVDKGTNLMEAFWLLESGIPGRPPVNSYTDAVGIAASEFYRVTVSTGWFVEGMALIPGGSSSGTNLLAEGESHDPAAYPSNYSLTVSAFYMDRCLVTKTQWDEVYNWATNQGYQFSGPGGGKGPSHPAQMVTWEDCVKWCNARSEKQERPVCYRIAGNIYRAGPSDGVTCDFGARGYRLPTDAEWEYAGRGGLTGKRYPWGDTIDRTRANYYGNPSAYPYDLGYAGFDTRYNDRVYPYSSPVGSFPPNGYGLYDMAGNAWEWCWDWYPGREGSDRVVRGSSWYMDASTCRVGYRFGGRPIEKCVAVGFRTVLPSGQ